MAIVNFESIIVPQTNNIYMPTAPSVVTTTATTLQAAWQAESVVYQAFGNFTYSSGLANGVITTFRIDSNDSGYDADIEISNIVYVLNRYSVDNEHLWNLMPGILSGDDFLNGTSGTNLMYGYGGNDVFRGNGGGDTYDGGLGRDAVGYLNATQGVFAALDNASLNKGQASGDKYIRIENLAGSNFNDTLHGTLLANYLDGVGGNDTLAGKAGADTLNGGSGQDIASYVDAGGVTADLLKASRNTGHAAGDVYISIENLSGSSSDDQLFGNNANNVLRGAQSSALASGRDQLYGRLGNDRLLGYDDGDTLSGGSGKDTMTGGSGADTFLFSKLSEMGKTASTRDVITDFKHSSNLMLSDVIKLSPIDANTKAAGNQVFAFIGASAFTGTAGQLHYFKTDLKGTTNDKTIIEGDVNGDRVADFQIELTGLKTLVGTDFIL